MKEKFTKGDWVAFYPHELLNDGVVQVETESGHQICMNNAHKLNLVEQTANMHLIAVAPKMYKVLDDLANGRGTDYPIGKLLAEARGEL